MVNKLRFRCDLWFYEQIIWSEIFNVIGTFINGETFEALSLPFKFLLLGGG